MTRPQISFGTDGWRAIIADEFTFQNVRACAIAVSLHLLENGESSRGVVVGYDTRFGSKRFASAVAEELNSYGIDARVFDVPAPTPACSFSVVDHGAAIGVMIRRPTTRLNGMASRSNHRPGVLPHLKKWRGSNLILPTFWLELRKPRLLVLRAVRKPSKSFLHTSHN